MTDAAMVETPEGADAPAAELEAQARRMGWRPKEEYRGSGEWVDADTFVRRGETELPILRARLRTLDGKNVEQANEIRGLRNEVSEVKRVLTDFRKFAEKGEERAFAKAKKELEEQRRTAAANADVAGVEAASRGLDQLDTEMAALKTETKKEEPAPDARKPAFDPVIDAWVKSPERAWFRNDPLLNSLAGSYSMVVQKDKPGLTTEEMLEEVEAEVKRRYPDKFGKSVKKPDAEADPDPPPRAAAVHTPGGQGANRSKRARTFANLPQDAKEAYVRFKRSMPDYTEEQYLKGYIDANGEDW